MHNPLPGWTNPQSLPSRSYHCSHCDHHVASVSGYSAMYITDIEESLYICPHCARTTSFRHGVQLPGSRPGANVADVPPDIAKAYNEARECMSVAAYTAAAMLCRKILMHVAVEEKAKENLTFKQYVNYLVDNNFVPPKGRGWVDKIREKGNDVNHELVFASREDATDLIGFIEMLLKFNYEFPAKVKPPAQSAPGNT
jgi:hypothetical protein